MDKFLSVGKLIKFSLILLKLDEILFLYNIIQYLNHYLIQGVISLREYPA